MTTNLCDYYVSNNLRYLCTDYAEVCDLNTTEVFGTNHLRSVTGHRTLTRCEIVWLKNGWCEYERYVRSVNKTSIQKARAFVTDKNLIYREIRIFVYGEAVCQCTDLFNTEGILNLCGIECSIGLEVSDSLNNSSYVW